MTSDVVMLQLPVDLYDKLQELATVDQADPIDVISHLIAVAHQRQGWLRDLKALREQIHQEGELQVGTTKEDVLEQLRQTRHQIFEAEYAHLYR